LTHLANAVTATGETVWYTGDTSMMVPQVEEAVQEYVDEVHSKAVAVVPLKEPHDKTDPMAQPRVIGALIIEQIEDSRPREGLPQRIEVVSEHSALALTNVLEHNELFLMPVWRAIGKSRWLVEARQLPWTITAGVGLVALTAFLCLFPAHFEVTGKGTLQPSIRRQVFADVDGDVREVLVDHGVKVTKGQPLVKLRSIELESQIEEASGKLQEATKEYLAVSQQRSGAALKQADLFELQGKEATLEAQIKSLQRQLELLKIKQSKLVVTSPIDGEVMTWHLHDTLIHRPVKIGDMLVTVVAPQGEWELEVKVPEEQMGFLADAQQQFGPNLPVEYITETNPGAKHQGKVEEVHRNAQVRGEEGNTVLVEVAINKDDVPDRRPGAGVKAHIDCGMSPIGYVWFHQLVSFVQKRIIFPLF
jgi:hypothetical protein